MAGGRLEIKISGERIIPRREGVLNLKESFLLGAINFCGAVSYIPYLAIGWYDVMLESHIL